MGMVMEKEKTKGAETIEQQKRAQHYHLTLFELEQKS